LNRQESGLLPHMIGGVEKGEKISSASSGELAGKFPKL
jgi:hypothetical protein